MKTNLMLILCLGLCGLCSCASQSAGPPLTGQTSFLREHEQPENVSDQKVATGALEEAGAEENEQESWYKRRRHHASSGGGGTGAYPLVGSQQQRNYQRSYAGGYGGGLTSRRSKNGQERIFDMSRTFDMTNAAQWRICPAAISCWNSRAS